MTDDQLPPSASNAADSAALPVPPEPPPYPTIRQVITLLVLLVLVQGLIGVVLVQVASLADFELDPALLIGVANLLSFGLVLWLAVRAARRPAREIFPFAVVPGDFWLAVLFTAVGWSILGSELVNVVSLVLPPPEWVVEVFSGFQSAGLASFLLLVVIAPVTEEFLFRGAILQGFLRRYSARKAILVSAVFFGALHMNPWQFGPAVVLGIIYGWWCLRTNSLAPALVGHALNNAVGLIAGDLLGLEIPGFTDDVAGVSLQPLWLDILGLTMFAAGILLATRSFARHTLPGTRSGVPLEQRRDFPGQ